MASNTKAAHRSSASPFELAVEHHRAGRVGPAEGAYRQALEHDPRTPQVCFLLGALLIETARAEEAVPILERGLRASPNDPLLLANLGEAHRRAGRFEEAAATLVRAVALKPDLAEASYNLGLTLRDLREDEAALECFIRAVDVAPEKGKFQARLASELVAAGELERAVGHYQAALALATNKLELLLGLAATLRSLRRYEGALVMARSALALEPTSVLAHYEVGKALTEQGHYDAAIAAFDKALQLSPDHVDSHFGLACALVEAGLLTEALQSFRKVIELSPGHRIAHSNLIYMMAFDPAATAADILREGRAWSRRFAEPFSTRPPSHENSPEPERRLRVGYVASTFHDHCQAFFLIPLLDHHDRQSFEIYCYASVERPDDMTARMRGAADVWRDIRRLDDAAAAELIRKDGIDVLIDLTMHMSNTRLSVFAHRPAPVQVSWLAYPGTTGLSCIDYRVTDPWLDPPGSDQALYSERALTLPDTFWCYDPLRTEPEVSALPAASNAVITFGCLNAFWKLHAGVFALWARVLQALPSSRLMLLAPAGDAQRRVLAAFEAHGVAKERITFVPRQQRLEYLATYHHVDICLDSFPYNGHTTSLDAFWMGVPVVTLVGDRVVGRAGLCQASLLGLPSLIAHTPDEFVERATSLASDLAALAALRAGLRERLERSPLMDSQRFTRNLETAYREAWREWCAKQAARVGTGE